MHLTSHEKIALRFSEAREKAGKTQADVADFLNVTFQAVSNWERGRTRIDSVSLLRCLLWFHADIYDFLASCDFEIMQRVHCDEENRERSLLCLFDQLNPTGQKKLLEHADILVSSGKYIKSHQSHLSEKFDSLPPHNGSTVSPSVQSRAAAARGDIDLTKEDPSTFTFPDSEDPSPIP